MRLASIYEKYPDNRDCIKKKKKARWGGVAICPYCGTQRVTSLSSEMRYHCNSCHTSFSATVNTVLHKTHLDIQKWILAFYLILNDENISVRQLATALDVHKNTAWFLLKRITEAAMETSQRQLMFEILQIVEKPDRESRRSTK